MPEVLIARQGKSQATQEESAGPNMPRPSLSATLIAILMVVALMLRWWNLGALNLWCDEDITALAVQGVLEKGYPQLPSGMYYFRAPIFTYLTAFSATVFGIDEFALRLPSLLFAPATVLLLYLFGVKLFGRGVGLIAAAVLTFSCWDIEFARHARMYEAFAFFFTASLYAIYRGVCEGESKWFGWSVLLTATTILVHILGAVLALLYLMLPMRPEAHRRASRQCYAVGFGLAFLGVVHYLFIKIGFALPEAAVFRADPFDLLQWPPVFFAPLEAFTRSPRFAASLAISMILSTVALVYRMLVLREVELKIHTYIFLFFFILLLAGEFILLGILAVLIYTLLFGATLTTERRAVIQLAALLSGLALVFYFATTPVPVSAGTPVANSPAAIIVERVRTVISFPKFYFLGFLTAFPLMSIVAATGIWLFYREQRTGRSKALTTFLLLAFSIPLAVNGVVAHRVIENRINFYLNPLFVLFFAYSVFRVYTAARRFFSRRMPHWHRANAGFAAICFVMIFCEQVSPAQIYRILNRNYGDAVDKYTAPGSHLRVMPDHRSVGEYVRRHRRAGDIVIVTDWLAQHYYAGKIDYWLRTRAFEQQAYFDGLRYRDVYTATPILANSAALRRLLQRQDGHRIWIIATQPFFDRELHLCDDVLSALDSLKHHLVFTGRDGCSFVYLIDHFTTDISAKAAPTFDSSEW